MLLSTYILNLYLYIYIIYLYYNLVDFKTTNSPTS